MLCPSYDAAFEECSRREYWTRSRRSGRPAALDLFGRAWVGPEELDSEGITAMMRKATPSWKGVESCTRRTRRWMRRKRDRASARFRAALAMACSDSTVCWHTSSVGALM